MTLFNMNERQILENPDLWPNGTLIVHNKRSSDTEMDKVYMGTILSVDPLAVRKHELRENASPGRGSVVTYESVDDLLNDGWVVAKLDPNL